MFSREKQFCRKSKDPVRSEWSSPSESPTLSPTIVEDPLRSGKKTFVSWKWASTANMVAVPTERRLTFKRGANKPLFKTPRISFPSTWKMTLTVPSSIQPPIQHHLYHSLSRNQMGSIQKWRKIIFYYMSCGSWKQNQHRRPLDSKTAWSFGLEWF